jgi:hypothetical protein
VVTGALQWSPDASDDKDELLVDEVEDWPNELDDDSGDDCRTSAERASPKYELLCEDGGLISTVLTEDAVMAA